MQIIHTACEKLGMSMPLFTYVITETSIFGSITSGDMRMKLANCQVKKPAHTDASQWIRSMRQSTDTTYSTDNKVNAMCQFVFLFPGMLLNLWHEAEMTRETVDDDNTLEVCSEMCCYKPVMALFEHLDLVSYTQKDVDVFMDACVTFIVLYFSQNHALYMNLIATCCTDECKTMIERGAVDSSIKMSSEGKTSGMTAANIDDTDGAKAASRARQMNMCFLEARGVHNGLLMVMQFTFMKTIQSGIYV
jgi:hypothetical protein